MKNSFGELLRLTTFGESHGPAMGGILDGIPAGIEIDESLISQELDRRKPGQSKLTTARKETDEFEILSGVFEGKSLGTPIAFIVRNKDQRGKDYSNIKDIYRPAHADLTWDQKFGIRDYRGGGRSSARETVSWVLAGGIIKPWLSKQGVSAFSWVSAIGELSSNQLEIDPKTIDKHPLRTPDSKLAEKGESLILEAKESGDSLGGVISGKIVGLPTGLGEPVFNKFQAQLSKAFFSLNAVKGVEFGLGFEASRMKGSEHNDEIASEGGSFNTASNNAGGLLGGITNGMDVTFQDCF